MNKFQVQLSKTPQITFGIKHSPRLGQLKPIEEARPIENRSTSDTSQFSSTTQRSVIQNSKVSRQDTYDAETINDLQTRSHITQIRPDSEIRSATISPEPIQTTDSLTQEIVWVPEQSIRRGSYTIENPDGNGFVERYQHSEVIPVENGVIRRAESGEKGAYCDENQSSEVVRRDGFEQNVQRNVKNTSAHESKQTGSEEVRSGTEVQHLDNGGISKTTTTTTIRKVGTAAKTANATTSVTRTATAVTSRDVSVK